MDQDSDKNIKNLTLLNQGVLRMSNIKCGITTKWSLTISYRSYHNRAYTLGLTVLDNSSIFKDINTQSSIGLLIILINIS